MGCAKIIAILIGLAMPAEYAALFRPTVAQVKPARPVQVAYLDCGFDARNVYRCRP